MTNKWINTENSLPEIKPEWNGESKVYQVIDPNGFITTAIYDSVIEDWWQVDIAFIDDVYRVLNRNDLMSVFAYCELPIVDESISNRLHKELHGHNA